MAGFGFCAYILIGLACIEAELVNVHVLFRHGDRSPIEFLPTDNSSSSNWPMGPGQLTFRGMKQQFDLGTYLKTSYGSLIGSRYDPLKVHVRSTDVDRTLMSAQANLAGLYMPSSTDDLWNKNLHWYPVPVHTVSGGEDILLTDAKCPRIDQLRKEIYKLPKVEKISKDNAELFAQLTKWSGISVDLQSVWKVHDFLFCEKAHNYTTPEWNTEKVWEQLQLLNKVNWKLMFYNMEIRRLKMGLLIHRIARHMHRIQSNKPLNYGNKMMIYSGHDTDVAGILSVFGLFDDGMQPTYASCIMIELHRKKSGLTDNESEANYYSWFVRFIYRNATNEFTFKLPGCPDKDCSLHTFKSLLLPYKLKSNQRLKDCALKDSNNKSVDKTDEGTNKGHSFLITTLLIFLALVAIVSILGGFLIIRRPRLRRERPLVDDEEDVY